MAVDSTLFYVNIPAGTYAVGDKFVMKPIRGPAVVRDGYGKAIMKRVVTLADRGSGTTSEGITHIRNSNWLDEMANFAFIPAATTLAENSNALQKCGDMELQPNSSWEVVYEIREAVTTTVDLAVFVLIDIDYPQIAAVANPKQENGAPVTIYSEYSVTTTAYGASDLVWTDFNVDIFKAGFRYLLATVGARTSPGSLGFFSIHGAAGQAGLERIIPFIGSPISALRYGLDYSTPLVKGPMTISLSAMNTSSTTSTARLELDFIRR